MPLTDIAIRQAKPGTAPIKLSDGGDMYLLLNPNGARYWRFNYRIGGKAKTLSLGVYPEVPLKLARERRDKFSSDSSSHCLCSICRMHVDDCRA